MRKTSQDGGDATSATSGVENEMKKPKSGLLLEFKSKKVGKRTAPNLSEESDDAVVEPLLQKTTEKAIQSAKYFAKAKADTVKEISKLFNDKKAQSASTSGFGTTESLLSEKNQATSKPNVSTSAPLHNYMNTNVFHSHESAKANGTTKTQVLVEIDASKQSGYNPSPLIFTTAKIHTDGKSKHMEPVQMTPAPILSTIEVSVSKDGNIIKNEKKISNGTSVMNTVFTQPHVNEKVKENTVQISGSKLKQSKDLVLTDNNSNPTTSLPAKEKTQTEVGSHNIENIKEGIANISKSNNMTPVAQSTEVISNAANFSKSVTSHSNYPMKSSLPSEASKSTSIDVKNKLDLTKDVKETKKLVDEPRILMSESKLKSIVSENTKPIGSVTTKKPPQEPIKAVEPLPKLPLSIQSNKTDTIKFEKNKSNLEQDIDVKNTETIVSQPLQIKNIKSPVNKDHVTKPNTVTSKPLQQKSTPIEKSTSKVLENLNDPSAKTLPSSTKIPTQSKVIDNKLGKEIAKSPKPSANEITKPTSKISLNNTASPSINKIPTSASIVKPAPNVSLSNVTQSSNKAINSSSPSNVKTMNATVATSATTNASASSVKGQSANSKTATATVNSKPTSVTTAKSSTKASAKSSPIIKSPQISTPTSAAKSTVTAKTASVKPPPLAFTKTSQVNTSSPGVTAPIAKSAVSKVAQVSTSAGHKNSPPTLPSSSTSSESSNKTKAPESNKKVGSKPSDNSKDIKVSKA